MNKTCLIGFLTSIFIILISINIPPRILCFQETAPGLAFFREWGVFIGVVLAFISSIMLLFLKDNDKTKAGKP